MCSRAAWVRCDTGSNCRMLSSVSPKKSSREGRAWPGANRSRMPPRTANSPGSITVPVRWKPDASSRAITCSIGSRAPAAMRTAAFLIAESGGTRWSAALTVVSRISAGLPPLAWARRAKVAMRRASMSLSGEMRSYGTQSQGGKLRISAPGAKNHAGSDGGEPLVVAGDVQHRLLEPGIGRQPPCRGSEQKGVIPFRHARGNNGALAARELIQRRGRFRLIESVLFHCHAGLLPLMQLQNPLTLSLSQQARLGELAARVFASASGCGWERGPNN